MPGDHHRTNPVVAIDVGECLTQCTEELVGEHRRAHGQQRDPSIIEPAHQKRRTVARRTVGRRGILGQAVVGRVRPAVDHGTVGDGHSRRRITSERTVGRLSIGRHGCPAVDQGAAAARPPVAKPAALLGERIARQRCAPRARLVVAVGPRHIGAADPGGCNVAEPAGAEPRHTLPPITALRRGAAVGIRPRLLCGRKALQRRDQPVGVAHHHGEPLRHGRAPDLGGVRHVGKPRLRAGPAPAGQLGDRSVGGQPHHVAAQFGEQRRHVGRLQAELAERRGRVDLLGRHAEKLRESLQHRPRVRASGIAAGPK